MSLNFIQTLVLVSTVLFVCSTALKAERHHGRNIKFTSDDHPKESNGEQYIKRITGYFLPPQTGEYKFYSNCEETCNVFLSGNEKAVGKSKIISQLQKTQDDTFDKYPSQASHLIYLNSKKRYYIEADTTHAHRSSNTRMSVGVILPDDTRMFPIQKPYIRNVIVQRVRVNDPPQLEHHKKTKNNEHHKEQRHHTDESKHNRNISPSRLDGKLKQISSFIKELEKTKKEEAKFDSNFDGAMANLKESLETYAPENEMPIHKKKTVDRDKKHLKHKDTFELELQPLKTRTGTSRSLKTSDKSDHQKQSVEQLMTALEKTLNKNSKRSKKFKYYHKKYTNLINQINSLKGEVRGDITDEKVHCKHSQKKCMKITETFLHSSHQEIPDDLSEEGSGSGEEDYTSHKKLFKNSHQDNEFTDDQFTNDAFSTILTVDKNRYDNSHSHSDNAISRDGKRRKAKNSFNDNVSNKESDVSPTSDKASATSDRPFATSDRPSATSDRASSANERISSTSDRASATSDRASAANERISSTSDRASATSDRASAANERISSTSDRASATSDRASAASDRLSTTSDRLSTTNDKASIGSDRPSATSDRPSVTSGKSSSTSHEIYATSENLSPTNVTNTDTFKEYVDNLKEPNYKTLREPLQYRIQADESVYRLPSEEKNQHEDTNSYSSDTNIQSSKLKETTGSVRSQNDFKDSDSPIVVHAQQSAPQPQTENTKVYEKYDSPEIKSLENTLLKAFQDRIATKQQHSNEVVEKVDEFENIKPKVNFAHEDATKTTTFQDRNEPSETNVPSLTTMVKIDTGNLQNVLNDVLNSKAHHQDNQIDTQSSKLQNNNIDHNVFQEHSSADLRTVEKEEPQRLQNNNIEHNFFPEHSSADMRSEPYLSTKDQFKYVNDENTMYKTNDNSVENIINMYTNVLKNAHHEPNTSPIHGLTKDVEPAEQRSSPFMQSDSTIKAYDNQNTNENIKGDNLGGNKRIIPSREISSYQNAMEGEKSISTHRGAFFNEEKSDDKIIPLTQATDQQVFDKISDLIREINNIKMEIVAMKRNKVSGSSTKKSLVEKLNKKSKLLEELRTKEQIFIK